MTARHDALTAPALAGEQVTAFVACEGYFSVLPAWEFFLRDEERYGDLAGPDIDQVMRQLGWRYSCAPLCVMAMTPEGDAIALGWAARTNRGGPEGGVNLSYAVDRAAQGRGLALQCTSLALLELQKRDVFSDGALIHAQFDVTNLRSAGVAARLGLQGDRSLCLDCTIRGPRESRIRSFMGASAPWVQVRERAVEFGQDRQVVEWEPPRPAERRRHKG
jgi:hypothetical protein